MRLRDFSFIWFEAMTRIPAFAGLPCHFRRAVSGGAVRAIPLTTDGKGNQRMNRSVAPLYAGALLCLLFSGVAARAAYIPWTYSWSRSPLVIPADNHGTGGVAFTSQLAKHASGTTDVVASNLVLFSTAPASRPDRITRKSYALTLSVRDDTAHASGKLTFGGTLNGTLWAGGGSVTNSFTTPKVQKIHLGHYWYTVAVGPFVAPTDLRAGRIDAHVAVEHNPEPSGLVLGGLGLAVLALAGWRKYLQGKRAVGNGA
jgi:hypothetical protein